MIPRLRTAPWWLRVALALAALSALPPAPAAQDEAAALERRLKAAFLYKFGAYVEWPSTAFPRPETPVRIGVLGDDALAAELELMTTGRTIDRRAVAVQRVQVDDARDVHILFVARAETERLPSVARRIVNRPVLVVSDAPGALRHGSMVNFVLSEGRVRFEISLPAAEEKGLVLRSGLLAVARSVVPRTP